MISDPGGRVPPPVGSGPGEGRAHPGIGFGLSKTHFNIVTEACVSIIIIIFFLENTPYPKYMI